MKEHLNIVNNYVDNLETLGKFSSFSLNYPICNIDSFQLKEEVKDLLENKIISYLISHNNISYENLIVEEIKQNFGIEQQRNHIKLLKFINQELKNKDFINENEVIIIAFRNLLSKKFKEIFFKLSISNNNVIENKLVASLILCENQIPNTYKQIIKDLKILDNKLMNSLHNIILNPKREVILLMEKYDILLTKKIYPKYYSNKMAIKDF